ncbi:hypothetical protein KQX54_012516 [Cotesia glomerata]|uniref:Uncharacterized protein n=1 Tax=Cotesia glomerata TaxID=32391 RepID=A0AAV7I926_COTGL|nr:hypothetical protein KQX54_012516 [Cotesia glomerata]
MVQQRRNADGKKHIRTVLGYVLTDDFCCKLSWSETVAASNSRCSLDDCKQAIMSWLQHASDRVKESSDKHSTQ